MHEDILEAIGSPLVRIRSNEGTVAAKLEAKNPGGSAKDRPARYMVEAAERDGRLGPGDGIVEPTSGNTGIGLAIVGAAKGYDVTLVMPAGKSEERRAVMRAFGADLELVDGDIGDAVDRAEELAAEQGLVRMNQFENPANPRAHYETTGPEILEQVGDRRIDAFVAAVGTGGTITGTGRRLREAVPDLEVVGVEPAENAVLSSGEAGSDDYQGMGPGFVAPILDESLLDDVRTVALADAEAECRRLAREEGIFVGQSSGAASLAAKGTAHRLGDEGVEDPLVVTLFPDGGDRYLTTGLFDGD